MPLKIQKAVFDLIFQVTGIEQRPEMPRWLVRPGKIECGARWPLICEMYRKLTDGLELPEEMPVNNSRRVDGILHCGRSDYRVVEVDESQHFNYFRAMTLDLYPLELRLAFDLRTWTERSRHEPRQKSGSWAAPKPPLFPGSGGRHRQRAFRDALADILPVDHGFQPTLRIGDFEVKDWIGAADACARMEDLLNRKFSS
jgi:hypothetical protein